MLFYNKSNGYMLYCGGNGWDDPTTKKDVFDSRYLTISGTQSRSTSITYIANPTKTQKKANLRKRIFRFFLPCMDYPALFVWRWRV